MFGWSHCGREEKQLVQEMIVSRHSIASSCALLSVSAFLMIRPALAVSPFSVFISLLHLSWTCLHQAHSSLLPCCPSPFPSLYLQLNPSSPPVPLLNSPLLPVVPSQTNGAHYGRTKNSPAAKSIHFFFLSVFLSFSLPNAPTFFLFFVHPSGGKWVEGLSAHLSAGSPCAALCAIRADRLRLWDHGTEPAPPAVCLLRSLLYGHEARGTRWKWISGQCLWGAEVTTDITLWLGKGS